ncbi:hypothetical protein WAI453_005242 [Rhynchosporium graminicola]
MPIYYSISKCPLASSNRCCSPFWLAIHLSPASKHASKYRVSLSEFACVLQDSYRYLVLKREGPTNRALQTKTSSFRALIQLLRNQIVHRSHGYLCMRAITIR